MHVNYRGNVIERLPDLAERGQVFVMYNSSRDMLVTGAVSRCAFKVFAPVGEEQSPCVSGSGCHSPSLATCCLPTGSYLILPSEI